MSAPGERTPEEREAARRAREARRAGRAGPAPHGLPQPPPSPSHLAPSPPHVTSATGENARSPATANSSLAASDEHAHLTERQVPAAGEHATVYATDEHSSAPATDEQASAYATDEHEPAPATDEQASAYATDEHEPVFAHDDEVPAGIRSVVPTASGAPAPRPVAGERRRRGPRARRLRGRVLAPAGLLLVAAAGWFIIQLWQPFHGSGGAPITVTIPAHASAGQIGDQLERQGVIASSFFFGLRVTLDGERGGLLAGTYHLRRDDDYGSVMKALTTPPPAAPTTEVTIVSGKSRRQIDALLRAQGIRGSYVRETLHSRLLDPRAYGAPARTPSLEGFLFPSTFRLRSPISIGTLVGKQLAAFRAAFRSIDLRFARTRHLSAYDVIIIASILEKEAGTRHDLPLVASVIYNRLHDHMPLGMDSTTRYEYNDYTRPLTVSQLAARSPYNTRNHAGLPPTPIGNPGLEALRVAAHPAATRYLYFVAKPCGNGASVFSSTEQQFQRDSLAYQAARARRGNRSPVTC